MFEQILFYVFSSILVLSALIVVSAKNPVKGALALVLAIVCCSALWLLLDAEFLALVLVFVYVGAVMTLFLFVIMMLNLEPGQLKKNLVRYWPLAGLVVLMIFLMLSMVVGPEHFGAAHVLPLAHHGAHYSNIKELGNVLYTDYAFPFELAGIILLVAIVASITLSFRGVARSKRQSPSDQIKVRASERVRIVKMDSEQE